MPGPHYRVEHIMGMPIGIDLRDQLVDSTILDDAFSWFRWVDSTFSPYLPDSEVSRLARGDLRLPDAHQDVRWVLERCEQLRVETGGYFDIGAAPLPAEGLGDGEVLFGDPSGLVKGWSVDRAAALLEAAGAENYSINAGGDIRVYGGALPEAEWRIGIQHPLEADKVAKVVVADNLAIATSGAYVRGRHIIDPHSGGPPEGVLSVTVTGSDLATADAYATAMFAMGEDAPAWIARLFGYDAMVITSDERVISSAWFPAED